MNVVIFYLLQMHKILLLTALAFLFGCTKPATKQPTTEPVATTPSEPEATTPSEPEPQKEYKSVKIGEQVWMAENLNIEVEVSKCYEDKQENCEKYGRLYDWETAMKACPKGWHLPTKDEWNMLTNYIQTDKGCVDCDAKHLKATSGWNNDGKGLDSYGFAAIPGGFGNSDGDFVDVGISGYWWSTNVNNDNNAYSRNMYYEGEFEGWNYVNKSGLFSVRCVKD